MKQFLIPKAGLMDISPYKGGESKIAGVDKIIKLASNENAFGISPKAMKAIKENADAAFRYPDGNCNDLRRELAQKHNIKFEGIVCGAGTDEIIKMLCHAYAGVGDEVLYNYHGFLMYNIYAKSFGATPVTAPENNLTADVDALINAITSKTKIVFLANPNNPTGTMLPKSEIHRLAKSIPSNVLFAIDSAYDEYIDDDNYSSGLELVEDMPNVVVLKTFSKIYGLGGIRLGFCYCQEEIADVLNRVRSPFNVSCLAQYAGIAALDDDDFVIKTKKHNSFWLKETTKELNKIGIKTSASCCNFILARFPDQEDKNAKNADIFLRQHGIIARKIEPYHLAHSLRISVGLEEEMTFLISTLKKFMGA